MRLPSFNYEEFLAHVRAGPGFGCWKEPRIRRAWGKRPLDSRITAVDVAKRCVTMAKRRDSWDLYSGQLAHMCKIAHSMLSREAWKEMSKRPSLWHYAPRRPYRAHIYWSRVRDESSLTFIANGGLA